MVKLLLRRRMVRKEITSKVGGGTQAATGIFHCRRLMHSAIYRPSCADSRVSDSCCFPTSKAFPALRPADSDRIQEASASPGSATQFASTTGSQIIPEALDQATMIPHAWHTYGRWHSRDQNKLRMKPTDVSTCFGACRYATTRRTSGMKPIESNMLNMKIN